MRRAICHFVTRGAFAACAMALSAAGCDQKMTVQPRYDPLEASRFFADGSSARAPVAGTVPRGWMHEPGSPFLTGRAVAQPTAAEAENRQGDSGQPSLDDPAQYLANIPLEIELADMRRGEERFSIYCAACHGDRGFGGGPVVAHGYPAAGSLHEPRLRAAPAGYLFAVATEGLGNMPGYRRQISPDDRWRIVAYVRALQLSNHPDQGDMPGGEASD